MKKMPNMKKLLKILAKIAVAFVVFTIIAIVALWSNGKKEREAYERLIVCENEDSVCDYIFNHPEHTYRIEELKAHARTLGVKLKKQEHFDKSLKDGNYTLNEIIEEITNAYNSNIIDFSILPENSKIKIITYTPKEPEFDYEDNFYFTLIGTPCHEWREELFR